MKTADARLIALALFMLALSLPVSAWIQRSRRAAEGTQNTAVSAATAVPEPELVSPYQIVETRQGVFRLTRGNGESYIYQKGRWVNIPGG